MAESAWVCVLDRAAWKSGRHIKTAGTGRRSSAGRSARPRRKETADLLKIVPQGRKRRLRSRKISRLQILRQSIESLGDRIGLLGRRGRGRLRAFRVVMVVVMMSSDLLSGVLLDVLLKICVVLLRRLQVP
jgi:hypothetical protein